MKTVGFIGLGIMGKPMAKNVLKAGYPLVVYEKSAACEELRELGAAVKPSYEALGAACDVVITIVPDSPEVKEVVLGEKGLVHGMKAGSVLIDMSSISPVASREIAEELAKRGIDMLDAPVSGGEPGAINGTLTIMVGGKPDVFDAMKDLLLSMGASATLCGGSGAGNTTKLANQIITAVNIAAVSEALVLGKSLGVDPGSIFEAIRGGLAGSAILNAKAPMMIERNFKPGFKCELHLKDLKNVLSAGATVNASLPMAQKAYSMFEALCEKGAGPEDHSALVKFYEEQAGTVISEK